MKYIEKYLIIYIIYIIYNKVKFFDRAWPFFILGKHLKYIADNSQNFDNLCG